MLNWRRVRAIAQNMNPEPVLDAAWHEQWAAYYTDLVRRCEPLIAEEMGRALPQPVQNIAAFSRAEWVAANIVNFEQLFAPLERLHQDSSNTRDLGTLLMTDLNQVVLSSELGVLLGYFARRVLGQYDMSLLGREPLAAGRLYFVERRILPVCSKNAAWMPTISASGSPCTRPPTPSSSRRTRGCASISIACSKNTST